MMEFLPKGWIKAIQKYFVIVLLLYILFVLVEEHSYLMGKGSQPNVSPLNRIDLAAEFNESDVSYATRENMSTGKWVVLDGLQSHCNDITAFSRRNMEWRIVLVTSHSDQVHGCRFPRCLWVNSDSFNYFTGQFSVTQAVKKPNILSAFLLAMSQGANHIIHAECGSNLQGSSLSRLNITQTNIPEHHLFYNESKIFNPYQHFGYNDLYPRSFQHWISPDKTPKLVNFSDCHAYKTGCQWYHTNSNMYYIRDYKTTDIIQIVSASKAKSSVMSPSRLLTIEAAHGVSPVSISPATLAPLDTGFTIFTSQSFHLMYVPINIDFKEQELFRTLLLYAFRAHIPLLVTYINIGESDVDLTHIIDEDNINNKMFTSLKSLSHIPLKRGCGEHGDINKSHECMTFLVNEIIKHVYKLVPRLRSKSKILKLLKHYKAWITDIQNMKLIPIYRDIKDNLNNGTKDKNVFKIKYSNNLNFLYTINEGLSNSITANVFTPMQKVCNNMTNESSLTISNWQSPLIPDVALVIVLNYEFLFETLPYLEYLYRSAFRYIIYCGPSVEQFHEYSRKNGFLFVTYIDGFTHSWHFMYECVNHAMKLNLPVKGFLQIGDDVLLNIRMLKTLPRDRIWMPKGFTKRHVHKNETSKMKWYHWDTPFGLPAVTNTIKELQMAASSNETIHTNTSSVTNVEDFKTFATQFLQNYDKNIGIEFVIHRAIDIFYIPMVLKDNYIRASELFRSHNTLIELAVPLIHLGLVSKSEVVYMQGASLWRKDRDNPWSLFNETSMYFLHPFKSLSHLKHAEGMKFFCLKYLPSVFGADDGSVDVNGFS